MLRVFIYCCFVGPIPLREWNGTEESTKDETFAHFVWKKRVCLCPTDAVWRQRPLREIGEETFSSWRQMTTTPNGSRATKTTRVTLTLLDLNGSWTKFLRLSQGNSFVDILSSSEIYMLDKNSNRLESNLAVNWEVSPIIGLSKRLRYQSPRKFLNSCFDVKTWIFAYINFT